LGFFFFVLSQQNNMTREFQSSIESFNNNLRNEYLNENSGKRFWRFSVDKLNVSLFSDFKPANNPPLGLFKSIISFKTNFLIET
jgi:hypothetical protein